MSTHALRRALRTMNLEHATHATVARELFDGRASARIIKAWRLGTRHMAPWAIDLLADKAAQLTECVNEIPRGPGQRAGDKNLIRNVPAWRAGRDATTP